jgi:hypothetical protein
MKAPTPDYKELTSPENELVLGTLNPKMWRYLSVAQLWAEVFKREPEELVAMGFDPMDFLIHTARRSSGALEGNHRRDLVEALQGKAPPGVGVLTATAPPSVPVQDEPSKGRRGL